MPHAAFGNRKLKNATNDRINFQPKSIIDVLFDYDEYLKTVDEFGSIATTYPETEKHVAVVGGGGSGLVAAYELSRIKNVKVTVFEAARKLGGRMDSIVYSDPVTNNDKVFELGCMRFPATSWTLFHYIDKLGLRSKLAEVFPDPGAFGVNAALQYRDKTIKWPGSEVSAEKTVPLDNEFQRLGREFPAIFNYVLGSPEDMESENYPDEDKTKLVWKWYNWQKGEDPSFTKQVVRQAWQSLIDRWGNVSFGGAMKELTQLLGKEILLGESTPWTSENLAAFGALGIGGGGFGPLYDFSFLELLRIWVNGWETNQVLLRPGIGAVIDGLTNLCLQNGVTIKTNSAIEEIDFNENSEIYSVKPKNVDPEYFNSVIIATTHTVARKSFDLGVKNTLKLSKYPDINQDIFTGMKRVRLTHASKLFVMCQKKFWYKENNLTGKDLISNVQSDQFFRGLYCLDYDPPNEDGSRNKEGYGVVLLSYTWESDSDLIATMTSEEIIDDTLKVLRKDRNTDAENSNDVIAFADAFETSICKDIKPEFINWQDETLYAGAFKLNGLATNNGQAAMFYQFQDGADTGLFICGDSVSWAGGWLEGALPTGLNTAVATAKFLGCSLTGKKTPLDQIVKSNYDYSKSFFGDELNPPTPPACNANCCIVS